MDAVEVSSIEATQDATLLCGISQVLYIVATVHAGVQCGDHINSVVAQCLDQCFGQRVVIKI